MKGFNRSNCIWKDNTLTVNYKQPFDILAEFITDLNEKQEQEGGNIPVFENWLPGQDSNLRPSD